MKEQSRGRGLITYQPCRLVEHLVFRWASSLLFSHQNRQDLRVLVGYPQLIRQVSLRRRILKLNSRFNNGIILLLNSSKQQLLLIHQLYKIIPEAYQNFHLVLVLLQERNRLIVELRRTLHRVYCHQLISPQQHYKRKEGRTQQSNTPLFKRVFCLKELKVIHKAKIRKRRRQPLVTHQS